MLVSNPLPLCHPWLLNIVNVRLKNPERQDHALEEWATGMCAVLGSQSFRIWQYSKKEKRADEARRVIFGLRPAVTQCFLIYPVVIANHIQIAAKEDVCPWLRVVTSCR